MTMLQMLICEAVCDATVVWCFGLKWCSDHHILKYQTVCNVTSVTPPNSSLRPPAPGWRRRRGRGAAACWVSASRHRRPALLSGFHRSESQEEQRGESSASHIALTFSCGLIIPECSWTQTPANIQYLITDLPEHGLGFIHWHASDVSAAQLGLLKGTVDNLGTFVSKTGREDRSLSCLCPR